MKEPIVSNKMSFLRFTFTLLILFILFLILFACSNKEENNVVAEVGNKQITLEEYKYAYLDIIKKPDVFDSKELREQFLDELINTKILAGEFYKNNSFENDERTNLKIKAYGNKVLREIHFKEVIKPKIDIKEKDVEEAYRFTQEQRKLKHLFANTKSEADSLYQLLENGIPFDELAKSVFDNDALSTSGGNLGWVYWDQLNYDFAMTAFKLPANNYSQPVQSPFGYHIIKVTDYKKNPLITRQEYELHKRKAKNMLEFKIGEKLSYEYIDKLIENSNVTVNTFLMTQLKENLANTLKRKPSQYDQMNDMQLKEEEIKQIENNLWDNRNEEIASVNGKSITAGEFIAALNYIPYKTVYSDFKQTLDLVFRDFMLTDEAVSMGFDKHDDFKMKTEMYREYIAQLNFRRSIVRKAVVNEEEVKKYFSDNREKFKQASYDDSKEVIKKLLFGEKKRNAVSKYLSEIKNNIKIVKRTDIVHNYYDNILSTKG